MYYTIDTRAQYNDCDQSNRLKISAAMKYMQQTSSEHLGSLGFSPERLYEQDMVFLLTKMCVRVHRMPECMEPLVVGTAAIDPRGARFLREFVIESPAGERLVSAMSLWVLVDPATRKIYRPASFPYAIRFQEPGLTGVIGDEPLPRNMERGERRIEIPVRYSHLDVNRHVNNTCYADFVCDNLPYEQLTGRGIERLVLAFQNEARYGEMIEVAAAETAEGEYYMSGLHGGQPCFEALVRLNRPE